MSRILALQKLTVAEPLEGKHYGSAISSQPGACEIVLNN